jgi:CrcB protein
VLIGLALLGGLGSVGRVLVAEAVQARTPSAFPAGVLVVNVSGSLALGALVGAGAGGDVLRLLGIGLLGGYTTYSAWMVDTDRLTRGQAVTNVAVSLAAGLLAVWMGRML